MTVIGYKNSPHNVHNDAAIGALLSLYVEAIRDVTVTRTSQDERRVRDIEEKIHTAMYDYALARRDPVERCTHPNAYHLHGAHMFCPRCGEFNAMEE